MPARTKYIVLEKLGMTLEKFITDKFVIASTEDILKVGISLID